MMTREDKVLRSIRQQVDAGDYMHQVHHDMHLVRILTRIRDLADTYLEEISGVDGVLSGANPSDAEEASRALDGE